MGARHNKWGRFMQKRLACWLLLLLSGIIYGSSFSLIKIATGEGAHPFGLTFWFALIAAVLLGAVQILRGRFLQLRLLSPHTFIFCASWSLLGTIVPNILFFTSAREIPAGVISMCIAMIPILTFVGAVLLRHDKLSPIRILGILLGAAAVLMIILPKTSLPEPEDTIWVLLTFIAAACYAVEHLYFASKAPSGVAIDLLLFLMFSMAAIILLPITLITGHFILPNWPIGSTELAVAAVSLITVTDYFFFAILIAWAGAVFTSQAAYIVTLSGVLWGMLIFGESHSIWIWAAIICLIMGASLVRPHADS